MIYFIKHDTTNNFFGVKNKRSYKFQHYELQNRKRHHGRSAGTCR